MAKGKKRKMKDTIEVEDPKLGELTEEIIEEIVNRLPIKPLIRMKCISKGWCRLISEYQQRPRPRFSTSALFCHCKINPREQESQVIFLNAKEQGAGDTQHLYIDDLSFSIKSDIKFLGSSHGLLLCRIPKNFDVVLPYVCNPTLNQWFPLPPISKCGEIYMGLAFDGNSTKYNVLWFDASIVKMNARKLNCEIFSSDTGKWRKRGAPFFNSSLLRGCGLTCNDDTIYFYRKGMIHWVFYGLMLVYHFQKDFFKLIELPTNQGRLWELNGCLYYGDNYKDRCFLIFAYDGVVVKKHDDDGIEKWELKHVIEFTTLELQLPEIFGSVYEKVGEDVFFHLSGFNEDLQILYIALPGMIVSYSFETQRLKKVWTFEITDENDSTSILSMTFCASFSVQLSGVNLPFGGKLLHPERISQGSARRPCLLLK